MDLLALGLTEELASQLSSEKFKEYEIGRIICENKERYTISDGRFEFQAEITGNLRFSAASRADFPAVGDWVLMKVYEPNMAIIHRVLSRKTVLERQAVGKYAEKQIIAANIDFAFIVQSIDNNFNINRLERYLTICYSSGIIPILIITKIDLSTEDKIHKVLEMISLRDKKVETVFISNISRNGYDDLYKFLQKGKTYCLMGSSGVGKSSLINNLLNQQIIKTGAISESTQKGKHVTSHRELFILDNGSLIIDTPGMRELGMADNAEGIKTTFEEIHELSLTCKYSNCTHTSETGCSITEALEKGFLDADALDNYNKLVREQQRFQISIAEKRRRDKEFGKMCKSIMKEKKKNKF